MNVHDQASNQRPLGPELLHALRRDRRPEIRGHRPHAQEPYLVEMRDLYHGQTPVVLRPGSVDGSLGDPQARQRDADRDRAAGRQYRTGRRTNSASRRGGAVADAARQDPRSRSGLEHNDRGSRRHAAARARGGRRSRPALSAAAAVGRHLHHRRQSLHQCRRHRRDCARHSALACARPRSRAGRRPRAAQSQQAEEGQYRLRPEEPVHRRRRHARHHHRRGVAAGAAAALDRDRVCRRCPRRRRRSICWHRRAAHVGRRNLVRDDAARRRRSRGQTSTRRAAIRWQPSSVVRADRIVVAGALGPARRRWRNILSEGHEKGLVLDATIAESVRAGQSLLAHPRNVRRGAAPYRRFDQARHLGAGRAMCRLSSRRPMRRS